MSVFDYEYTMPPGLGALLVDELAGRMSRELVTVLAGDGVDRTLALGQVFGRITKGAVSTAADGDNTGAGDFAATPTLGPLAEVGDYTLTCITEAAGGGVFSVVAPSGYRLPDLTVGEAYAGDHINCTLADGDPDFIAGDSITVTVAPGSGKVVALAPAAVDGSQVAAGAMTESVTAPDGVDAVGVGLVRNASVRRAGLVWPDGITEDQVAAALAQLAAINIVMREEA